MDYKMKYVVIEFDPEDSWINLIAAFDKETDAEEMCLSLYQEQAYERFYEEIQHPYWTDPVLVADLLNHPYMWSISPADCNIFVMEVPCFGS